MATKQAGFVCRSDLLCLPLAVELHMPTRSPPWHVGLCHAKSPGSSKCPLASFRYAFMVSLVDSTYAARVMGGTLCFQRMKHTSGFAEHDIVIYTSKHCLSLCKRSSTCIQVVVQSSSGNSDDRGLSPSNNGFRKTTTPRGMVPYRSFGIEGPTARQSNEKVAVGGRSSGRSYLDNNIEADGSDRIL
ncbi:hypothetical protein HD554DRAFT_2041664 [Boletus coccyginus]|nr:hypothetical protein HD554DRAFT_2041664 [Boletus coccyginus]